MKTAVLIPCLNEALTISNVVRSFRKVLPQAEIHVFDNLSEDRTVQAAQDAGAIVHHVPMRGKGNVVLEMFREIEADIYVMVDGDDTYPAEEVLSLISLVAKGDCDMSVGRRVAAEGQPVFRKFHRLGNSIITKIINFIFGSQLQDVFSGFRVFNRKIVQSLPLLSKGFEVETELTLQALDKRFLVREIDVTYRCRPPGSYSKLRTYSDGLLVAKTILSIIKYYRPLAFFSVISLIAFLFSVGFGSFIIGEYLRTQQVLHPSTAVLATGLMLVALLALTTGFVLDSTKRHYHEQYMLMVNHILRSSNQAAKHQTIAALPNSYTQTANSHDR